MIAAAPLKHFRAQCNNSSRVSHIFFFYEIDKNSVEILLAYTAVISRKTDGIIGLRIRRVFETRISLCMLPADHNANLLLWSVSGFAVLWRLVMA